MENEPEVKVNLPPVEITINDNSTTIAPTSKQLVIPPAPVQSARDDGKEEPPDTQEVIKQIRELTNKSVLIALQKLTEMLPNLKDQDIQKFVDMTLKLLDAQMAFDWSDRFAKTILKNPALLKNLKGGGGRTGTAQGNMARMKKLEQGDGRTTPKKLKHDMPQDEEEAEAI